ncbi:MAG: ribose-5-phosphate isomerase RpiA [Ignavibacteriales bacterium]|nr:ribose-5-phosphate isomerase RpiA [Ignavibacteriales bacterium]MCF8315507.1 ribose-5-phosphate isomerase RpiA [Ignavibacteriales bacterium]MCF8436964.1 ribose-5-phosphate isomerase RpiA [Ignavibacteriales bacterium]
MSADKYKKEAAMTALEFVKSGMVLGLGTGSTTKYLIEGLGKRLSSGEISGIKGIPTSSGTKEIAEKAGIPLTDFLSVSSIDLAIDGADESDHALNLIKGGGGALLYEKIVAGAAKNFIIIADESKYSKTLGEKWPVPLEVIRLAYPLVLDFIDKLGGKGILRCDDRGNPFSTDEGNYIIDANFGEIKDPARLEGALRSKPGIVETGLFIGMAKKLIISGPSGTKILYPQK